MRHHSGIFLPFLSHNSAAILLKKRQKPAQKHVSNILRKNFKQLLNYANNSSASETISRSYKSGGEGGLHLLPAEGDYLVVFVELHGTVGVLGYAHQHVRRIQL